MPGGPHQMGTQYSSSSECLLNIVVSSALQTQADRPFCCRIILGLDSDQPLHRIDGLFKWSSRDMLVEESLVCNVQGCHLSFTCTFCFHPRITVMYLSHPSAWKKYYR